MLETQAAVCAEGDVAFSQSICNLGLQYENQPWLCYMDSVFPSEQLLSSFMKLNSLQGDCKKNSDPEAAVAFMAL